MAPQACHPIQRLKAAKLAGHHTGEVGNIPTGIELHKKKFVRWIFVNVMEILTRLVTAPCDCLQVIQTASRGCWAFIVSQ